MVKTIVEQFIKEEFKNLGLDEEDTLGCVEEPEFSYIIKIERKISKGKTETSISYRDTRIDMDYKLIHETIKKEDYKRYVDFFKKEGYHKL